MEPRPQSEGQSPQDPEAVRAKLAETWTGRAVSEHEATIRFGVYARRMEGFGVPLELIERTLEASADEKRHEEICLEVARRFGAREPVFEHFEFWRRPDSREVLLSNMVATCCLTETLNAPFLALSLHIAKDPAMKIALRDLLKDEVNHGRLGWAYLAWARQQGDGARLSAELPELIMDSSMPQFFNAGLEAHPLEAELAHFGELSMAQRRRIFFEGVDEVIFPGLEASGIDTQLARAWVAKPVWREH
jgi:hypothetical protein